MSPASLPHPAVAVSATPVVKASDDEGRRLHYGEFYGLRDAPAGAGVVVGNCQAESLRIVIDTPGTPTVRVPPVHEIAPSEVPLLHRLISRAPFLVAQPVRDDYHGLPLGTGQLRALLPAGARAVTVPIVRYTGLQPFQWVIRVPEVPELPPYVDYLDVRQLALAAGLPLAERLDRDAVRAVAVDALAELRRREDDLDVAASDLFSRPTFDHMRTVNHPGNPIWLGLGARVLEALGSPHSPTDPGRPLLAGVQAPREAWVADAWGLADEPTDFWLIAGERVAAAEVREAQGAWYRDHPIYVERAVGRLAPLLRRWRG